MTYEEAIAAGGKPLEVADPPERTYGEAAIDGVKQFAHAAAPHIAAAGHGFLQSALGDFGDEAVAGMTAGVEPGTLRDVAQAYHEELPAIRKEFKAADRDYVPASTVGHVIGAVASPLNKLTGGGSMLKLAASGALMGGVSAAGHSEASNVQDLAADTGIGAGIGSVAAPLIGAGINKLAPGAQAMLERMAGKMGVWSTGATGSNFAQIAREGGNDAERPAEVGLELLKRNLVGWLDKPAAVQAKVNAAIPGLAADKAAAMEAEGPVDLQALLARVAAKLKPSAPSLVPEARATQNAVQRTLGEMGGAGSVPFKAADNALRDVQDQAYNQGSPVYKAIAPAFRQEMRGAASNTAPAYQDANDSLSKLLSAKSVLDKRVPQMAGHSPVGILPAVAGAVGTAATAAAHSPSLAVLGGLGLAGVAKLTKDYGSPIGANVTFKLAQALRTAPERFGKYAPTLLRAMQEGPRALYLAYRHFKDNNVDMSGDASGGTPGMGQ